MSCILKTSWATAKVPCTEVKVTDCLRLPIHCSPSGRLSFFLFCVPGAWISLLADRLLLLLLHLLGCILLSQPLHIRYTVWCYSLNEALCIQMTLNFLFCIWLLGHRFKAQLHLFGVSTWTAKEHLSHQMSNVVH